MNILSPHHTNVKRFLTSVKKNLPVKRLLIQAAVNYLKSTGVIIKPKVMLLILPSTALFANFTLNVHTVLWKRWLNSRNSKPSENFRSFMNNQGSTTVA